MFDRVMDSRRRLAACWAERFTGNVEPAPRERWLLSCFPLLFLICLASLLFFARLGCPLLEPEEARYAEIAREMLEEGRWLTPVFHGEEYYQKPPLLYWLIMVSYRLFGNHDWSARLVPCCAGILVVVATHAWGRWTVGPRAAFASAAILCLSGRFLYLGGMVAMDSLLCLWVVAGLACGHLAMCGRNSLACASGSCASGSGVRVGYWLASAVCCGLGIMTKGPVAAVLVVGPLAALQLVERRRAFVRPASWLAFLGVTLAVAAPWYVSVSLHDPEASGTFFWLHNVVRYLAPFDHEKPAWFYLPGLAAGMLPWSVLLIPLGPYLWRRSGRYARRRPSALGFFLLAFGWCLLFFSMSGCKRPGYILPALPALALVLGTFVTRTSAWRTRAKRAWALGGGLTAVCLLAGSLTLMPLYHDKFGLRGQIVPHLSLSRQLPVYCYPRRWDSVSFYLGREVESLGADCLARWQESEALVFVKTGDALTELLKALPTTMEFMPRGQRGGRLTVGVLKPRALILAEE